MIRLEEISMLRKSVMANCTIIRGSLGSPRLVDAVNKTVRIVPTTVSRGLRCIFSRVYRISSSLTHQPDVYHQRSKPQQRADPFVRPFGNSITSPYLINRRKKIISAPSTKTTARMYLRGDHL